MGKRRKQKRQKRAHRKNEEQISVTEYILKPGIDLSKTSDRERLDITETDENEDEGLGDGNMGQPNADFGNGLRDV